MYQTCYSSTRLCSQDAEEQSVEGSPSLSGKVEISKYILQLYEGEHAAFPEDIEWLKVFSTQKDAQERSTPPILAMHH